MAKNYQAKMFASVEELNAWLDAESEFEDVKAITSTGPKDILVMYVKKGG